MPKSNGKQGKIMSKLSDFEITKKWPASNPDVIQLYSLPTPNGVKVSVALEEMGLDYEPHLVDFGSQDQMSPEFISLSSNNKIPAIIDPNGPGGDAIGLFESGAILIYLAEKSGKLLSSNPAKRYETIQWLMFQMGGAGPMFGQLGFFTKFAGAEIEDPRPRQRYIDETIRLLGVVEKRLTGRDWLVDDYSIADIALAPWLKTLITFYDAGELLGWENFPNVDAYIKRFSARPAVEKGAAIPGRP